MCVCVCGLEAKVAHRQEKANILQEKANILQKRKERVARESAAMETRNIRRKVKGQVLLDMATAALGYTRELQEHRDTYEELEAAYLSFGVHDALIGCTLQEDMTRDMKTLTDALELNSTILKIVAPSHDPVLQRLRPFRNRPLWVTCVCDQQNIGSVLMQVALTRHTADVQVSTTLILTLTATITCSIALSSLSTRPGEVFKDSARESVPAKACVRYFRRTGSPCQ